MDVNVEQVEQPEVTTPPPTPLNEQPADGPGSGRSALRKQLEKGFEDGRRADRPAARQPQKSRARQELEQQDKDGTIQPTEEESRDEETEVQVESHVNPPDAWTKEAKAEWANVPPQVQQAVLKREQDTAKGVEELKRRYGELDEALKPHLDVIKQHGHSPAAAVKQMFAWFDALSADRQRVQQGQPPVAFAALAQSFGFNPQTLFGQPQTQQQPQQTQPQQQTQQVSQQVQEQTPQGLSPELTQWFQQALKQYLEPVAQKIGTLESTFQRDSQFKTNEILSNWAKDKPYFEEVRQTMAYMLQPDPRTGQAMIPPRQDGTADLDRAYDYAVNALPEVRAKVRAEEQQKAAEARKAKQEEMRKAQQEQADKARKASVGLGPSAPGMPAQNQRGKGKVKSVRESIMAAVDDLRE